MISSTSSTDIAKGRSVTLEWLDRVVSHFSTAGAEENGTRVLCILRITSLVPRSYVCTVKATSTAGVIGRVYIGIVNALVTCTTNLQDSY